MKRMVLKPQDGFERHVYEPDQPERKIYQPRISTIRQKSIKVLQSRHWDWKKGIG